MNIIFFLLPLLISISIPLAFAETEHGKNYDREIISVNSDGSQIVKETILFYDRVFNGTHWVDFIHDGNQVQTSVDTVILNADGSYTWLEKGITDKIVAKYADISNLNSWTYPNTLNNDVPDNNWNGTAFVSTKNKSGVGNLNYVYLLDGMAWKTQLEAKNLSALTTKVFGFDEIIDLNRDTIKFGGVTRNLDNFNGTTFGKEFLDANQGKVIDFLNGATFDFDKGYENLHSVTVYDTGANKSRLVFDYRTSEILLPNETLLIDPMFTNSTLAWARVVTTASTGAACSTTFDSFNTAQTVAPIIRDSDSNDSCYIPYIESVISSIPDDATITDVTWSTTVSAITSGKACDINHASLRPSVSTGQNVLNDMLDGDNTILNNNAWCQSEAPTGDLDLGSGGVSYVQSQLASDYVAFYILFNDMARDSSSDHFFNGAYSTSTLTITYSVIPPPDAVDDLTSPTQSYGTVDLSWTEPELNGETCEGYQINYTTPYGNPNTIITNNTATCTTSTQVIGLGTGTPYTFGVSVWTAGGNNATHPPMTWYNITTGGNFTIGDASFNQTNPFVLPITFEEQTINGTAEFLNVTFSNTFNLACDFHYKFANTNQTYTNLTSYAVSSTLDETSFVFTNGTNEIIDVYCWDQITDTNARYLLKQTDFPILDQILGFRAGDYGTAGMFGVFDLVTLLVIIGSMIGLNRENESVGIVFNVMLMFSLSFFGIIELTTVIFGMIALVLVFVITSTKKS